MNGEALIIAEVCARLSEGDVHGASETLRTNYPFTAPLNAGRRFSRRDMTAVFVRDGFIDRYTGGRLVLPAVLRVISTELPDQFPFHKNWKMSETHPAYWDLIPTIDHLVPVAQGGLDDPSNWMSTSMTRNAAKGTSTLEQLGWKLHPPGDLGEWDGLSRWLLDYLDRFPALAEDGYVMGWVRALRSEFPRKFD